mgnify:CR=1 FL=1
MKKCLVSFAFASILLAGCEESQKFVGTVTEVRITTSSGQMIEKGGSPVAGAVVGALLTDSPTGAVIGAAIGDGPDHVKIEGKIEAVRVLIRLSDGRLMSFCPVWDSDKGKLSTLRPGDKMEIEGRGDFWHSPEKALGTGKIVPG